ncbi:FlgO family outer membrane protein [Desulfurivibrio sp. D14AmB]|uniref:FlgO family outer membrane protein n=1 Tax=Desulfurivibrio sp. D14AmB TaxID=3374370 RepID=UPI00376ED9F2
MGTDRERGGHGLRILGRGLAWSLVAALLAGGCFFPPSAAAFIWPFSKQQPAEPEPTPPSVATAQIPQLLPEEEAGPVVNEALLLARQISLIGEELFAGLGGGEEVAGGLREGVIVLSFVDQKQLTRTTSFGRHLAEQLMNELQRRQVPVVELRKSKEVRVQERGGEYGLSRNPAEIADRVAAGAMLTGTYTITAGQVMVNARIIDNRSALLLAAATVVIPRTAVVNDLLADPVSGPAPAAEPMYMKRLEL